MDWLCLNPYGIGSNGVVVKAHFVESRSTSALVSIITAEYNQLIKRHIWPAAAVY